MFLYLWKVSESNLTFVAFLSPVGVAARAAACVDVTLLGHRADRAAPTLLQMSRSVSHITTQEFLLIQRRKWPTSSTWRAGRAGNSFVANSAPSEALVEGVGLFT